MNSRVQTKISELRLRNERLHNDEAICLQLEASLVTLSREHDESVRSLQTLEHQVAARRTELETKSDSFATIISRVQEQCRNVRDAHGLECQKLEGEIVGIADEGEALDNTSAFELSRLKRQSAELADHEEMLRERLRHITDEDAALALRSRKLAARERALGDIARVTLCRLEEELKQRELLLHE